MTFIEITPLERMFMYASEGWKPVWRGMGVISFEKPTFPQPEKICVYSLTRCDDPDPAEAIKPYLRYEWG